MNRTFYEVFRQSETGLVCEIWSEGRHWITNRRTGSRLTQDEFKTYLQGAEANKLSVIKYPGNVSSSI